MSTLRRSSSSYGSFADGIIIRGMPLLTLYPGNVYWVDSNGGGGSKGTFSHPVATLAAAHSLVTTDNGDIIVAKPGHAESPTTTVDFSKSGFAMIGLGYGNNRPTITNAQAAATEDVLDFAGDDVVVYNFKYAEGAPAATSVTVVNCSGDNFHIEGCYIELGAKTLCFLSHDTTAKKGLTVVNNTIVGTAANVDVGVRIEKAHYYAEISGNKFLMAASTGIDSGCVVFVSGAGYDHLISENIGIGWADGDVLTLQTVTTQLGLVLENRIHGADASDHLGLTPAGGLGFINNFITQPGCGVPALLDNKGARPTNTTPAT